MQLKTLEWAIGLRESLEAEIRRLAESGLPDLESIDRVVSLRQQLSQVDTLIAALKAHEVATPDIIVADELPKQNEPLE